MVGHTTRASFHTSSLFTSPLPTSVLPMLLLMLGFSASFSILAPKYRLGSEFQFADAPGPYRPFNKVSLDLSAGECIAPRHATPHHTAPHHTTPEHNTTQHNTPHRTAPHRTAPRRIAPHHTAPLSPSQAAHSSFPIHPRRLILPSFHSRRLILPFLPIPGGSFFLLPIPGGSFFLPFWALFGIVEPGEVAAAHSSASISALLHVVRVAATCSTSSKYAGT